MDQKQNRLGPDEPESRIDYYAIASEPFGHIKALEIYSRSTNLNEAFRELLKLRVSQMNACPYCINMHSKAARQLDASKEQIEQIDEWASSDLFNEKEKVALELAEHITRIGERGVDDKLYEKLRAFYDEKEYVDLVIVINQVNMWNRITISMGVH